VGSSPHLRATPILTVCASNLSLFDGPKVLITVGKGAKSKMYRLPQALVCSKSTFFKAAFDGAFKEALEQEILMEEDDSAVFDMLVQYIYTGQIHLPIRKSLSHRITDLLSFFKLADKVDLQDPLTFPQETFETLCSEASSRNIHKKHLEIAFSLPTGHVARTMLAGACVLHYFNSYSGIKKSVKDGGPFKFENELETIPGFGAELLAAVGGVIASCRVARGTSSDDPDLAVRLEKNFYGVQGLHPLTGKLFWF
jgi:hypothetical protein